MRLPYFHGVRVIRPVGGSTEEGDGLVLRLQLLWKTEGNLDNVLRNMLKLGVGLRSFVPEMSGSIRSGLTMEDLFESTKIIFGYESQFRVAGKITLVRPWRRTKDGPQGDGRRSYAPRLT